MIDLTGLLLGTLLPVVHAAAGERVYLPLSILPRSIVVDDMKQMGEGLVADPIIDTLFEMGEGFQISPVLAKSVSWKKGGTVMDISLNRASFSDGGPVTADDVLRTLRRCIKQTGRDELSPLQSIVGYEEFAAGRAADLRGLTKFSELGLRIEMTRPTPLLPDALTSDACDVVKGETTDLLGGALGTGAYKVESADEKEIVLRRRADRPAGSAAPEFIVYRGTADWGDFEKLKEWATMVVTKKDPGDAPGFRKFEYSPLGNHLLLLNNSKPPFDDPKVREAVSLAVDFGALAADFGWRKERLQAGLFPFGMRGFKPRRAKRDLAKAASILRAAGFTESRPLKFTVLVSRTDALAAESSAWTRAFAGAPIAASVQTVPPQEMGARKTSGDFEAARVIAGPGSYDGYKTLIRYRSRSEDNVPRASAPECDALTLKALALTDIDARNAQYGKADDCLMSRHVLVPLASLEPRYALIRKPWSFTRTSRYNLYPYSISLWKRTED